jgi:hypothetical protein
MLIGASNTPSDFYLDTVRNLCANTTYEFAAWALNMMLPSGCSFTGGLRPNVTFNIEDLNGNILGSYNTGDIGTNASPTWVQYGFFFTTPASASSVVLRMTNNGPGGCGNDIALDDITFRACGPTTTASFNRLQLLIRYQYAADQILPFMEIQQVATQIQVICGSRAAIVEKHGQIFRIQYASNKFCCAIDRCTKKL